jgi:tRNA(adenine34) deaminase
MKDHHHFMAMALREAEAALAAGEFPVGCILVHDQRMLVSGRRHGTADPGTNEVDHAEMIALRRLTDCDAHRGLAGIAAYITLEPCLMCLGALILNRVETVVYAYEDVMGGATRCDLAALGPLYRQSEPVIIAHVRRTQSLRLFQAYFRRPDNHYWNDSLLARYTLDQP